MSATLARSTGVSGNKSDDEHNREHNNRQCDHRQRGSTIVLYVPQVRPRSCNELRLNLVTPRDQSATEHAVFGGFHRPRKWL